MIFEIVFSKKAKETFDAIRSQIFDRWGETGVRNFEHRTVKVLEIILENPLIYQAVEYDQTIRKAHIHKNCSIFYQVRNEKIILAFFWDNRQDPIFL